MKFGKESHSDFLKLFLKKMVKISIETCWMFITHTLLDEEKVLEKM